MNRHLLRRLFEQQDDGTTGSTGASGDSGAQDAGQGSDGATDKTVVEQGDGGQGVDAGKASAPKWPDDWRSQLADGDEKTLKKLERYTSPKEVAKALRAAEQRISSGELKPTLPKDAKPEEIAQWRKDNGIPEKPEEYDLKFDNGLVIGEEDKPAVDEFVKAMHGTNATPDQVKAGLGAYLQWREQEVQRIAETDADEKAATEDALRAEWGGEYRRNLAAINSMLDGAPSGVKEMLSGARSGKSAVFNNPQVVQWFAQIARELNPAATVVPGASNPGSAISDEIAQIEGLMGDRASKYWKGPEAEKLQQRYRDLVSVRDKTK
jgi:hypothetical protein